jgi:hypothetical protein
MEIQMATAATLKTSVPTGRVQDQDVDKKIQQLRELFADAPELGKKSAGECASRTQVAGS